MNELFEIAINEPKENRTCKDIYALYNRNLKEQKISYSTIHKTQMKKLNFSYVQPQRRYYTFFGASQKEMITIFLYRLFKDLTLGLKFMYFDEFGMQSTGNVKI